MTIHVLLTADNHLDPSAVQYGPKRFERKRDFQRCFEVLVNFALENKPDIFLIGGDFYDGILPGNPTRAFVAEQFKRLHEKNIKTVLVSGHHDTPRSTEQGASPLTVHERSGHIYFLHEQHPTSKKFNLGGETVNVIGMSLNPSLPADSDPLAGQEVNRDGDINIFLTHYPIEGFDGYFGRETHIQKSSIPRNFQLFASGHLHNYQRKMINGTPVIYPGSTERVSFNEEGEKKGFVWLELDKTGIVQQEFQPTPAPGTRPDIPEPTGKSGRPRETLGPRSLEAHSRETSGGGSRLKLLSLYAHNFKKLKFSQPLPFSEGISLITGLNESGKSTILDAILFALFGRMIRPSQKPSNEEILSYGTGEAQVRLEFAIGDLRYRVVREVHKTRPNRAQLYELGGDGRQKTLATTVNDTTSEIERLLGGITYNEIVASSVVAQKDLERLIKQRLDDRRKVVNVFLNLDSFNRVQDQLDAERSRIEGTTRNPGHLTVERERLQSLQDQLKRYREAETQLATLA